MWTHPLYNSAMVDFKDEEHLGEKNSGFFTELLAPRSQPPWTSCAVLAAETGGTGARIAPKKVHFSRKHAPSERSHTRRIDHGLTVT